MEDKMNKKHVLFVCIHNSARSQMAEAFLKQIASDRFEVESAGIEPGNLNPVVIEVMKEIDIDISGNKTQSVQSLLDAGKNFDYIFTVCDETQAERCPLFPGEGKRIHVGFPDPSSFQGSHEEKMQRTREVRDMIKEEIKEWIKNYK
ncbi:MAG: arsenate reductase ArsC [Candidatus Omnitrophica bacterium]|nr:arsenate reductase ArsC [Candidatus Omnitrophota bacterium]